MSPAQLRRMVPLKHLDFSLAAPRLVLAVGLLFSAVAQADIPRTADGKPDFSGIWQTLSGADYGLEPHSTRKDAPPGPGVVTALPYQDWALKRRDENFKHRHERDTARQCFSLGTPRGVYYPEPFQIFQRERDLTLLFQRGFRTRTIHTNGSVHPEGPIGFWFGDSRAHWEGDTLVVDVVDFTDQTWLDSAGNFHSEELHVVERWSYVDENTIQYAATIEDPQVFTQPWSFSIQLHRIREPNFQLIENACYTLDYDQYYPIPAAE
jgi:U5 snRNP spliceosome subunit